MVWYRIASQTTHTAEHSRAKHSSPPRTRRKLCSAPAMPQTEAYRPGLLSSLLLGGDIDGTTPKNTTAVVTPTPPISTGNLAAREHDGASPSRASTTTTTTSTTSKKKKRKKEKTGVGVEHSQGDGGRKPAGADAQPVGQQLPVVPPPAGPAAGGDVGVGAGGEAGGGLAALFSASKLRKFKRREREDKEADAAEASGMPFLCDVLIWCVCFTCTLWYNTICLY